MMQEPALPKPSPIPASPHIKNEFVVQMVQNPGEGGQQQWPPVKSLPGAPRPHDFLSKCATEGGKRVAWPPHLAGTDDSTGESEGPPKQSFQGAYPLGSQGSSGPNQTTTYPSGFKLREEAPMDNRVGAQVVPAQPAFKITAPIKARGDDKWPPRSHIEQQEYEREQGVREIIRPKGGARDYSEFFAQNALPNNYPGYRAPPGTQHVGAEE